MQTETKLPDDQEFVLEMLEAHGPRRFTGGTDLSACQVLFDGGYIEDQPGGDRKRLTRKGRLYLNQNR